MIAADLETFTAEILRLSELYDKPISEALGLLYFDALSGYPIVEVVSAMRSHIRQSERGRFFPKPADLIFLLEGDQESQALRAWSLVAEAFIEPGTWESVSFTDTIITQVLADMGGWIAFCDRYRIIKEEPFIRGEFVKRYRDYATRGLPEQPVIALPGLCEVDNRQKGYFEAIPAPVMIGAGKERLAIEGGRG